MSEWFYEVAGESLGPFTSRELIQFATSGRIDRFTLVRRGESGEWVAAESVKGLNFASIGSSIPDSNPPPTPTPSIPQPIQVGSAPTKPPVSRVTFDHILFGWTRVVSYLLVTVLALAAAFYVVVFFINMIAPSPIAAVTLSDVRPQTSGDAVQNGVPEEDDRIRFLHGTPISENLQKYMNGSKLLLDTYSAVTKEMDFTLAQKLISFMEGFASELDKSDLKPRERIIAFDEFLWRQVGKLNQFESEIAERKAERSAAGTKFLIVIGLSVLASLVLVLLGIESNTRKQVST